MKTLMIATHQRGFEADPVMDELRGRGLSVFRFNFEDRDQQSGISFTTRDQDPESITFSCDGNAISGGEVGFAWCQQLPRYLGRASNEEQCLQRESLWVAQRAALESLEVSWLNRPSAILRASNKLAQLHAAQYFEMPIPETLISNTPDEIRVFAKSAPTVAKNLATPWVLRQGDTYAAHTKLVEEDWLSSDDALAFCPVIYQRFHPRKRDYRVVVIGDRTYSVSCQPAPHQEVDVRRGESTGEGFAVCEFDSELARKLRKLMTHLQIDYCAADFIEDKRGNLYFLEINTCGAWWWTDRFFNGDICRAITDYLQVNLLQGRVTWAKS